MNKKNKVNVGDVVQIPLKNGCFCFARVLEPPLMAFYNFNSTSAPPIQKITSQEILFKIWVMDYAVTSERWKILGNQELEKKLTEKTLFFKQDTIDKSLSIYVGGEEYDATPAECRGLERAAIWEPEHVEDRLRDHYLGVPNIWVESLGIR